MNNSTFFLLTSDRSGSNLLLRIMNSHPQINAPSPTHVFPVLTKTIGNFGNLLIDKNWYALIKHTCELINSGFGGWQVNADEIINDLTERSLSQLIQYIYNYEKNKKNKVHSFIKLHDAYDYYDFIKDNYTDVKHLHLVRDPRDMALSWLNAPGLKGGIIRAAEIWKKNQKGLDELSKQLKPEQSFVVHYEQLLKKPHSTLHKICDFLEVDFSKSLLSFHNNNNSSQLAGKIDAWKNLSKPLMKNNFKKYKKELSALQIEYIESVCCDYMTKYSYICEHYKKNTNTAYLKTILEKDEPWLKASYLLLSIEERRSHQKFRQAIAKCHSYKSYLK